MRRDERGFALIITLIITALLVAMVTEFITDVYVDTSARQSYVDGQQASLLADSGIAGALMLLQLSLPLQRYSSLQDRWAQPIDIAEERGSLRVTIEEENAKLSLNQVTLPNGTPHQDYGPIAQRLLKNLKLSPDLLDSLADWVDTNNDPNPGGAESAYYKALKPAYEAKNSSLDTLEELRLIKGVTREAYAKLQPFVTVYTDSAFNINTAPKEVLMALDDGITASQADRIIEYRKTTPFQDKGDLSKVPGMDTKIVSKLGIITTTKGSIFRLRAEALVNGATRTIETVVQTSKIVQSSSGNKPATLYWREY